MNARTLNPFLIRFQGPDSEDLAKRFPMGIGVTAFDEGDAVEIVSDRVLAGEPNVALAVIERIEDLGRLDQTHMVPNVGNQLRRGVWFPRGFEAD